MVVQVFKYEHWEIPQSPHDECTVVNSMSMARRNLFSVEVSNDEADEIVKIFKALADQTRIRIISTLTKADRFYVSELADLLGMDISRISHQLAKLEQMGFVKNKREGRNIYYELQDQCIRTILRTAKNHVCEN